MLIHSFSSLKHTNCETDKQTEIQNKLSPSTWNLDYKLSTDKKTITTLINFNDKCFKEGPSFYEQGIEYLDNYLFLLFDTVDREGQQPKFRQIYTLPLQVKEGLKNIKASFHTDNTLKQYVVSFRGVEEEQENPIFKWLNEGQIKAFQLKLKMPGLINMDTKDAVRKIISFIRLEALPLIELETAIVKIFYKVKEVTDCFSETRSIPDLSCLVAISNLLASLELTGFCGTNSKVLQELNDIMSEVNNRQTKMYMLSKQITEFDEQRKKLVGQFRLFDLHVNNLSKEKNTFCEHLKARSNITVPLFKKASELLSVTNKLFTAMTSNNFQLGKLSNKMEKLQKNMLTVFRQIGGEKAKVNASNNKTNYSRLEAKDLDKKTSLLESELLAFVNEITVFKKQTDSCKVLINKLVGKMERLYKDIYSKRLIANLKKIIVDVMADGKNRAVYNHITTDFFIQKVDEWFHEGSLYFASHILDHIEHDPEDDEALFEFFKTPLLKLNKETGDLEEVAS
ncbi:hypothetical protein CDIK_3738 [Cucumispora dikerogammari]|nr:hypothetical protein CDIK_3738 [Cucumispora dikerogammari]